MKDHGWWLLRRWAELSKSFSSVYHTAVAVGTIESLIVGRKMKSDLFEIVLRYIRNYFLTGLTAPPPPSKEVWVWVAMMEDFFEVRGVPGAAAAASTAAAAPAAIVA